MKHILSIIVFSLAATSSVGHTKNERTVSHEKVQFSHRVDAETTQSLKDNGVSQDSRSYYREITGKELNEGVEVLTDGESAVIKLTPGQRATTQVGAKAVVPQVPFDLELYKGGEMLSVQDPSIRMQKTSDSLRNSAPQLFKHSEVMKIPQAMGRGKFKLKAKTKVNDDDRFVLYVLDQNSDIELKVDSPKSAYSQNENLIFTAGVSSKRKLKTQSINTVLVAPDGRRFPIKNTGKSNRVEGNWKLDIDTQREVGELWSLEVESTVLNDQRVATKRIAKIALDIHPETASLNSITTKSGSMNLLVNVIQRGRYEVRALVAGIDDSGKSKPVSLTYHAEWLEPGLQSIEFPIDKKQLTASNFRGPFVVQSVQLLDQSRMSSLSVHEGKWIID
ncbi:MAG: DUF4785 family protein [Arenicella sp.]|nr:DUF4785 family protein [Arenicella sp.]